jgi:hypothetical protein
MTIILESMKAILNLMPVCLTTVRQGTANLVGEFAKIFISARAGS